MAGGSGGEPARCFRPWAPARSDCGRCSPAGTVVDGQTEGQINRLKTIKRQMYERANIELLRARLVAVS